MLDVVDWAIALPMIYRHVEGAPEHVHEKAPARSFADLMRDGFDDGTSRRAKTLGCIFVKCGRMYALAEACSSYEPQMGFRGLTSLRHPLSGLDLPMMRRFVDGLRNICRTLPHPSLRIRSMMSPLRA